MTIGSVQGHFFDAALPPSLTILESEKSAEERVAVIGIDDHAKSSPENWNL